MVARKDLATDPALKFALLLARRGTAHFGRKLNELRDLDLEGPSRIPGWSRRHVVAHVSYQARALVLLAEGAGEGGEPPTYPSRETQDELISFGATLAPLALRNLLSHSAVHLDVQWRDTTPDTWWNVVELPDGSEMPLADTVWLRAHEVWCHSVDFDNGARWEDLPPEIAEYQPSTDARILACLSRGCEPMSHGHDLRP
ncbi:maleylpyruvate isomerase family mycothiol-dependent enzyme [Citricoccus nitrophenolicus]|uniref:maleylpyruvate isomerase family mycothiol-dependent enzyme n=1 Tax=Citricoccus nitrophenolicus TaxID=863575 RepID=UPI0033839741